MIKHQLSVKPVFELKNRLINVSFLEFSNIRLHILFLFFHLTGPLCVIMCKFWHLDPYGLDIARTIQPRLLKLSMYT